MIITEIFVLYLILSIPMPYFLIRRLAEKFLYIPSLQQKNLENKAEDLMRTAWINTINLDFYSNCSDIDMVDDALIMCDLNKAQSPFYKYFNDLLVKLIMMIGSLVISGVVGFWVFLWVIDMTVGSTIIFTLFCCGVIFLLSPIIYYVVKL